MTLSVVDEGSYVPETKVYRVLLKSVTAISEFSWIALIVFVFDFILY
jgi:hypothetical protein